MNKNGLITAAVIGSLAVVFGAFGAHALKEFLDTSSLAVWNTAVTYQFYHVFAIIVVSMAADNIGIKTSNLLVNIFRFGILLFSGSLYLLSTKDATGWEWVKWLGPVTPLGGLLFIFGWLGFGFAVYQKK